MPITLPPIASPPLSPNPSRRQFLAGALLAAAGCAGRRPPSTTGPAPRLADTPETKPVVGPERFALLSDIHIAADPNERVFGANMFDNLRRTCDQVLATGEPPSAVLIAGDLAFQSGEPGDYAKVVESLGPLRRAGLPAYMTLGNHDDRQHFWQALPEEDEARKDPNNRPVEGRQAMVVESRLVNWLILDSLQRTTATPGRVGQEQLKWLAEALDARREKPALVVVHHDPIHGTTSGLRDTAEMMEILRPRRQVKALIFGHTHNWEVRRQDGQEIHWVNLPPTSYLFVHGKPNGWVEATVADNKMTLQLHCLDPSHPQAGERVQLDWRA